MTIKHRIAFQSPSYSIGKRLEFEPKWNREVMCTSLVTGMKHLCSNDKNGMELKTMLGMQLCGGSSEYHASHQLHYNAICCILHYLKGALRQGL